MEDKLKQGEAFFTEGKIEEAKECFLKILKHDSLNKEAFNNLGVIAFHQQDIEEAVQHFTKALEIDPFYKDAVLNYADVLRSLGLIHQAVPILEKILDKYPDDKELSQILYESQLAKERQIKIVVLCLPGLESFLGNIVSFFKTRYEVRTCYSSNQQEIESAVLWADLVWMEWANEMAVNVTRNFPVLSEKGVICRLHSYEAFVGYPKQIDWTLVNRLVVVSDHLKNIVMELAPEVRNTNIKVIPNGIDLNAWKFAERKAGYDIAYVGSINYKKGSILLPHLLKAACDRDPKYRLHIAGEIQDARYVFYFKQMLQDMGLTNNFIMYGKIDDIDAWLEDKNYIVSTSLLESQQLSICEAMAKGIKPVIHNFVGARSLYPDELIFNTMGEAADMLCSNQYDSEKYRRFVSEKYNMDSQLQKIDALLQDITSKKKACVNGTNQTIVSNREKRKDSKKAAILNDTTEKDVIRSDPVNNSLPLSKKPLVSILIATHNRASMLDELLTNLQDQTYKNYELVVVNDHSADNTESVIRRWIATGLNIRHVRNKLNVGGAASFDRAYAHSKGDYVLILSDDDLLRPDALEKMIAAASSKNAEIVYCDLDLIDTEGNAVGCWRYEDYEDYRCLLTQLVTTGLNRIPECPLMTRKSFEEYRKTYKDRFISTYYIMSLRKLRFAYVPEALYRYRVHLNSQASDMKGMWQRNKGVINHINTILFMYSFAEIFPKHYCPKSKETLANGYAIIAKILFEIGKKAVKGHYYNGLKFEEKDGLFLLFYKYAYLWLKKAIRHGAGGQDIEELLGALSRYKNSFEGDNFMSLSYIPRLYDMLPDFALLPKSRYRMLVALDVLVLGTGIMPKEIPIYEEGDRRIVVKFHHFSKTYDADMLKCFLRSNLIHVVIAKGCENGCIALEILDQLELFSIPVIVFATSIDGSKIEKIRKAITVSLSPGILEYGALGNGYGLLGMEGVTESLVLEKIREVFEI